MMRNWIPAILLLVLFTQCTPEPQAIDFGHEACHYCKMTIVDPRYGGELVTKKGKVYKYDAAECLIHSVFADKIVSGDEIHSLYVIDFSNPKNFIKADQGFYLHSKELPSPMGMFLTAFVSRQQLDSVRAIHEGDVWNWEETKSYVLNSKNMPENEN